MRTMIPALFLCFGSILAADKPASNPVIQIEDKLALREAQLSVQQDQIALLELANQILKTNLTFNERQKSAQTSQANLASKLDEVTQKLRKASGCKDCALNDRLEFVPPEKPAK